MRRRKGILTLLVVAALVISLAADPLAFKAKEVRAEDLPTSAESIADIVTVKAKDLKNASLNVKVYVNGTKLKKKGFYVNAKINGTKETLYYVPAKLFVKALGGKYSAKGKNVTLTLNGWNIKFTVGKDGYAASVTEGLGALAPISIGQSYKKGSYVYIPVELFTRLYENLLYEDIEFSAKKKTLKFTVNEKPVEEDTTWFLDNRFTETKTPVLTDDMKQAFDTALESSDEDNMTPVACIATAEIMGNNYAFVCRQSGKYVLAVVTALPTGFATFSEIVPTNFVSKISDEMLMGGWENPSSTAIDASMIAAFENTLGKTDGTFYTPIALLENQLVQGMNYCVLCKTYYYDPEAANPDIYSYALVYVYIDLQKNAEVYDIVPFEKETVSEKDYELIEGNTYAVYTEKGLQEILFTENEKCDNTAVIANDITVTGDIESLGYVKIKDGKTLTVEKGGCIQASFEIDPGTNVIVKNGGKFWTTMGGEQCIVNKGTITVEKGGELQSMYGGSIVNEKEGKIILNGTFYCGSVHFNNENHFWFNNKGTVEGKGTIRVYGNGREEVDFDWCKAGLEKMIGTASIQVIIDKEHET